MSIVSEIREQLGIYVHGLRMAQMSRNDTSNIKGNIKAQARAYRRGLETVLDYGLVDEICQGFPDLFSES